VYAIIETGGKQYRVTEGDTVDVELLGAEPGQVVELDRVLLVSTDEGVYVGRPTVEGATVRARVVDTVKGPKIVVFKYKPKKRYRRKTGHRQKYTRLLIEEICIEKNGESTASAEEESA
jgi:large subunit ribosomal protein L21